MIFLYWSFCLPNDSILFLLTVSRLNVWAHVSRIFQMKLSTPVAWNEDAQFTVIEHGTEAKVDPHKGQTFASCRKCLDTCRVPRGPRHGDSKRQSSDF